MFRQVSREILSTLMSTKLKAVVGFQFWYVETLARLGALHPPRLSPAELGALPKLFASSVPLASYAVAQIVDNMIELAVAFGGFREKVVCRAAEGSAKRRDRWSLPFDRIQLGSNGHF